jgi:hypothetical protein
MTSKTTGLLGFSTVSATRIRMVTGLLVLDVLTVYYVLSDLLLS